MLIEEEPSDQGSNEDNEPDDAVNSMHMHMAAEVPKEDTHTSSTQSEKEPEKLPAKVESSTEPPPKKLLVAPKNCVTSWSDWVAKSTTNVEGHTNNATIKEAKESTSQSRVKR